MKKFQKALAVLVAMLGLIAVISSNNQAVSAAKYGRRKQIVVPKNLRVKWYSYDVGRDGKKQLSLPNIPILEAWILICAFMLVKATLTTTTVISSQRNKKLKTEPSKKHLSIGSQVSGQNVALSSKTILTELTSACQAGMDLAKIFHPLDTSLGKLMAKRLIF